jgi:ABC-type dipeptide/oligopeptide/nickel transport system ATPase component
MILEIKNLHLSFLSHGKKFPALRGVSFALHEKEKIGIVGGSGSGKSALVKAILKLHREENTLLEQGEIWYKGNDITHLSDKEMQKIRGKEIGMIFQDPMSSLNPTLKIGFQIAEGFLRHNPKATKKDATALAFHLLQAVGISDPEMRLNSYPHMLSGGLRQRVMIAIALAASPSLLIADECTTALDVTIQAQILDLMKTLQEDKSTIFITHDLSIAASSCDRILVMHAGQIVEDAPAQDLFSKPQHPYTKRLLQAIPQLEDEEVSCLL